MSGRARDPSLYAMGERRFAHAMTAMELSCALFLALGATLPFAYASPLMAVYRHALGLDTEAPRTLALFLGITGGSIAGKWAAHLVIVRLALRARLRWAWRAMVLGLLSWLVLDTATSLSHGAWANAVLINPIPCLVLGPQLWRVRTSCDRDGPCAPLTAPSRAVVASMLLGAMSGVVIAAGLETVVFAPWWSALGEAIGEPEHAARAIGAAFAGPIGGSTLGQFAMLAWLARRADDVGARAAWAACAASILVWFAIDTAYSATAGGAFNAWMVNVPTLALTLPPLAYAYGRARD